MATDEKPVRDNTLVGTREGRYEEGYLGDGLYVYVDEARQVWLYTSNGIHETNRLALDPHVLKSFERWLARVREKGL